MFTITPDYGKLGVLIAVGGAAYSIYLGFKLRKTAGMIDLTVNELASKTSFDVADSLIEAAVQRAIDREIRDVVKAANLRLAEEIRYQVKDSVDMSYTELKTAVSDEIAGRVKNIDIRAIEKEAVSKAKEAISEKFDNKLDDLLEDFNDNLNNVSKIYASIAKTMSGKG